MHPLSDDHQPDSPPQYRPDAEETLRQAREMLTVHGVSIRPEFWDATVLWYQSPSRGMVCHWELVCHRYCNLVMDAIHEVAKRR